MCFSICEIKYLLGQFDHDRRRTRLIMLFAVFAARVVPAYLSSLYFILNMVKKLQSSFNRVTTSQAYEKLKKNYKKETEKDITATAFICHPSRKDHKSIQEELQELMFSRPSDS